MKNKNNLIIGISFLFFSLLVIVSAVLHLFNFNFEWVTIIGILGVFVTFLIGMSILAWDDYKRYN